LLAKERQDLIYQQLQREGAVTVATLVETFQVSLETIRRDLLAMEKQGLLSRVHGGAISAGNMTPMISLKQRNLEHNEGKRELAQKVLSFINEDDIIGIDSGSTAIPVAEAVKSCFSRLTVVTHSSDVFDILKDHADFTVILCGGHYLKNENAFYGPVALKTLRGLHVKKAFVFPSSVSLEFGIGNTFQELHLMQQQLLSNADQVYILADSSKFEKRSLLKLSDMKQEYCYISDNSLSEELRRLYAENNLRIY